MSSDEQQTQAWERGLAVSPTARDFQGWPWCGKHREVLVRPQCPHLVVSVQGLWEE